MSFAPHENHTSRCKASWWNTTLISFSRSQWDRDGFFEHVWKRAGGVYRRLYCWRRSGEFLWSAGISSWSSTWRQSSGLVGLTASWSVEEASSNQISKASKGRLKVLKNQTSGWKVSSSRHVTTFEWNDAGTSRTGIPKVLRETSKKEVRNLPSEAWRWGEAEKDGFAKRR